MRLLFYKFNQDGNQSERYRVRKFADIESRFTFDFIETINKRVAMKKKLSRSFGNVKVIFQKFFRGVRHFEVGKNIPCVFVEKNFEIFA